MKAIFVSHTHYDHVLDLVEVQKRTGAKVFGSLSALNIGRGGHINENLLEKVEVGRSYAIGKFKITVLAGEHSPHFLDIVFAGGEIEQPLSYPSHILKYKAGHSFNYFIEHPSGSILFHAGDKPSKSLGELNKRANLVVQGIAQNKKIKDYVSVIEGVKAKKIIPVHYENLLSPLADGVKPWFVTDVKAFEQGLTKKLPSIEVIKLRFGQSYIVP